jgi:hypothetical protein
MPRRPGHQVGCPELEIDASFVARYVHVSLAAIDEGFAGRIGTNRAGGIFAIIEGHLTGLDQHNHWSWMAMPTSVAAAGCNDDLLDHRLLRVIHLNDFLTLPLDLEFEVGSDPQNLPRARTGAPHDFRTTELKQLRRLHRKTAATIATNANCRPVTMAVIFLTAYSAAKKLATDEH